MLILLSTVEENFSNKSLRSRKRTISSGNSIKSCAHCSTNCSDIWEPLKKSGRLSENTANLCQVEEGESRCDALASQEKDNIEDLTITESLCDAVASQERANVEDVAVTESL